MMCHIIIITEERKKNETAKLKKLHDFHCSCTSHLYLRDIQGMFINQMELS